MDGDDGSILRDIVKWNFFITLLLCFYKGILQFVKLN